MTDAESSLYEVGDLIDMRDREHGAWCEGKITRIVCNPDIPHIPDRNSTSSMDTSVSNLDNSHNNQSFDKENDVENKPPSDTTKSDTPPKTKSKGIIRYFSPTSKPVQKKTNNDKKTNEVKLSIDDTLLFKVHLDDELVIY